MINGSYTKHIKIVFWVWESCERETKKKERGEREIEGVKKSTEHP